MDEFPVTDHFCVGVIVSYTLTGVNQSSSLCYNFRAPIQTVTTHMSPKHLICRELKMLSLITNMLLCKTYTSASWPSTHNYTWSYYSMHDKADIYMLAGYHTWSWITVTSTYIRYPIHFVMFYIQQLPGINHLTPYKVNSMNFMNLWFVPWSVHACHLAKCCFPFMMCDA